MCAAAAVASISSMLTHVIPGIAPAPGKLTFCIAARPLLDQLNRSFERTGPVNVADQLLIADRLHGRKRLACAAIEQAQHLLQQARLHHGINALVDTAVQRRAIARQRNLYAGIDRRG